MSKFSWFLLLIWLLSACNSTAEQPEEASGLPEEIAADSPPELVVIRPEARVLLEGWPQFQSLEARMGVLREAKSREELKLLVEELTQICLQVEQNAIPEVLEKPSVRSRLKVVQTYLGKMDAALFYRTDTAEPLGELMVSYNALRQQFNVIVSNTLTPDIFQNDTIPDTD